ncbi:MAG: thioredoxin family protein [Myxococcales bacterium]|nr:thioredoxin family protein [Myxococcales bacterium]
MIRRISLMVLAAAGFGCAAALFPDAAHADALTSLEAPFKAALESGSFGMALALVFAAGLATSLTPCVYPMIVITVSVFGAQQATSRLQAAKLSTAFVLGMATLFTPLGVGAALTGDVFGAQLSNPWVVVPLSLFFIVLATSMFGAFDLDLPSGLKNRLATVGGVGVRGAFLLGLVNALIAAPCTGPVVGFLLTWVGTTQNVVFGALSFFVYALGLGMLFWLVGTFSMSLPKSGRWLEWIKSVFGIVMLVAALYFLRDMIPGLMGVPTRTGSFLLGSLAVFVVGIALGAIHLSYHGTSVATRARKSMGVAMAVAGIAGGVGYLEALPAGAQLAWMHDFQAAKARAQAEGKPLLVDFGASWCGACGELERHTFSDDRVVREGQRFIPVKVDLSPDKDTPEKRALLASYEHRGLPLVVLHHGSGDEAARVTSFVPAEEFLELMKGVN